jgi:signal peptidase I
MSDTKKNVIKEIISYVLIIGGVLLIKAFVMSPIIVNGDSMNKTLKDNDIMILNKWSYHFDEVDRFDIVVVKDEDGYLIKRVIGLPGDIIYYMNNNLYINVLTQGSNYITTLAPNIIFLPCFDKSTKEVPL